LSLIKWSGGRPRESAEDDQTPDVRPRGIRPLEGTGRERSLIDGIDHRQSKWGLCHQKCGRTPLTRSFPTWKQQPSGFFDEAVIDADGSLVATGAGCKQGVDIARDGTRGYHRTPLS
jgi:hypothetical protein